MTDMEIERITKIEERCRTNSHRIAELDKITKEVCDHNAAIAQLVKAAENTNEMLKDHGNRLKDIEQKPSDRLSQLIGIVIAAVTSGIIGYVISVVLN